MSTNMLMVFSMTIAWISVVFTLGHARCSGSCDCKDNEETVDCSGAHLSIIPELTHHTLFLDMTENNITELSTGDFQNGTSLKILNFSRNGLERIEDGTFDTLSELTELQLSNNKLIDVNSALNEGLVTLKVLNMAGNPFLIIKPGTFQNLHALESLNLSGDFVANGFNFSSLSNLARFDISNCEFEGLSPRNFHDLPNLQYWWMKDNMLNEVPTYALKHKSKLKEVDFSGNEIKTIPRGAFQGNNLLQKIIFTNNLITMMDKGAFMGLSNLKVLQMEGNMIARIESGTFNVISSDAISLYLGQNPLNCDCNFRWLLEWIDFENKQLKSGNCSIPLGFAGRPLSDMSIEELQCPPQREKNGTNEFHVAETKSVAIRCPVKASSPAKFQWFRGSESVYINNDAVNSIYVENKTLKITSADQETAGIYTCAVNNNVGSLNVSVAVIVDIQYSSKTLASTLIIIVCILLMCIIILSCFIIRAYCPKSNTGRYHFLMESKHTSELDGASAL